MEEDEEEQEDDDDEEQKDWDFAVVADAVAQQLAGWYTQWEAAQPALALELRGRAAAQLNMSGVSLG